MRLLGVVLLAIVAVLLLCLDRLLLDVIVEIQLPVVTVDEVEVELIDAYAALSDDNSVEVLVLEEAQFRGQVLHGGHIGLRQDLVGSGRTFLPLAQLKDVVLRVDHKELVDGLGTAFHERVVVGVD